MRYVILLIVIALGIVELFPDQMTPKSPLYYGEIGILVIAFVKLHLYLGESE